MRLRLLLGISLFLLWSCEASRQSTYTPETSFHLTILQLNDVYEISALEGGQVGGMARVASIRDSLLRINPNTLTVLCGDFLYPSLIGTLEYEGEKIEGKQMVEVMNKAGIDLVTFGNHEFDLDYPQLQKRINESEFMWVSSNVLHRTDHGLVPFEKNGKPIPTDTVLTFVNPRKDTLRLGVFGITLPSNPRDYVKYLDWMSTGKLFYQELTEKSHMVLPVTHLSIDQDMNLAKEIEVPLIIGGHEHNNMLVNIGTSTIAKADANAKTVYIHHIYYFPENKEIKITSDLLEVNASIPFQQKTQTTVNKWQQIANQAFKSSGFNPDEVIITLKEPWDGRESTTRHKQCNLGHSITKAMFLAGEKPDAAIINSGAIRLDDQLSGKVTQYDIMRTLPYGGPIVQVRMTGRLLQKILRTGFNNEGNGGFLQWYNITFDRDVGRFLVQGDYINMEETYEIMMPDFLLTGLESNMDYLTRDNPQVLHVLEEEQTPDLWSDIRQVWINYLKTKR